MGSSAAGGSAAFGALNSTYLTLPSANYGFTGKPIHQYGYDNQLSDCRSGVCQRGYLWINTYIAANQVNAVNAAGKCTGVCGVPADYKPFATPLIPWGSTAVQPNMPAGTDVSTFWDTHTVWVPLNNGTVVRTTYNPNLNPLRNQYIGGPRRMEPGCFHVQELQVSGEFCRTFTFDAFNVFNHPNNTRQQWKLTTVPAPEFFPLAGQANPARQLQLSVRFAW